MKTKAGVKLLEAPIESPNSMSHVERYHAQLQTQDRAKQLGTRSRVPNVGNIWKILHCRARGFIPNTVGLWRIPQAYLKHHRKYTDLKREGDRYGDGGNITHNLVAQSRLRSSQYIRAKMGRGVRITWEISSRCACDRLPYSHKSLGRTLWTYIHGRRHNFNTDGSRRKDLPNNSGKAMDRKYVENFIR